MSGVVSPPTSPAATKPANCWVHRRPRYLERYAVQVLAMLWEQSEMTLKLLSAPLAIAFLALSLSGCNREPAPVASAPEAPAPPAPQLVGINFDEAALFEFDKADLKPEGKAQLDAYREKARAELSSAASIRVVGYTDNTGTAEHNSTLSQQRADAVRDYLVSVGVDATKLEAVGAADANPIADNSTEEGRAKNRRVEVEVIGLGK